MVNFANTGRLTATGTTVKNIRIGNMPDHTKSLMK